MRVSAWDPRCALFDEAFPDLTPAEIDLEKAYTNLFNNVQASHDLVKRNMAQFKASLIGFDNSLRSSFIELGLEEAWNQYINNLGRLLLVDVGLKASRFKCAPTTIHTDESLLRAIVLKKTDTLKLILTIKLRPCLINLSLTLLNLKKELCRD